jgi:hypothetical protein
VTLPVYRNTEPRESNKRLSFQGDLFPFTAARRSLSGSVVASAIMPPARFSSVEALKINERLPAGREWRETSHGLPALVRQRRGEFSAANRSA